VTSFAQQRERMVETQLRRRGITDPRVLEAMRQVPREEFVLPQHLASAYDDCALPITSGQTISQPYTVAFMCEAARIGPDDTVLEIGTGSGYGAAVLSRMARSVETVERIPELAERASEILLRLGYENIRVHLDDGTLGWAEQAPYDAILVTAGAETLPEAYHRQLVEGGRLVIPLGSRPGSQTMYCFTRQGDRFFSESLGSFSFVPLVSGD
jgi:protein-L-isoaspartate(D-aspartate) O-methyltransferase